MPRKRRSIKAEPRYTAASICFGALEIVAVYLGEAAEEEYPYGFVRLAEDVLDCDVASGDTLVSIGWLEDEDDNGQELALWPQEGREEVPVGSLICAVTDKIIEKADGSIQIPHSLHAFVQTILDRQLEEDYDPTKVEDVEMSYEKRMSKRKRNTITVQDEAANQPARKKKKRAGGALSRVTPRPHVKLEKAIWERTTVKSGTFSGDTYRASKEVIRAVRTSTFTLLKKLIKDKKNVADLYIEQSPNVPLTGVHFALMNENQDMLQLLHREKDRNAQRVSFPPCSLDERTSGRHTSRYADYNRYQVAASRGGKEGNNAFMKNAMIKATFPLSNLTSFCAFLAEIDAISLKFLKSVQEKLFQNNMFNYSFPLHLIIRSGHLELAAMATRELLNKGLGLNSLHADVLASGGTLDKFRGVSVSKKSDANASDCGRFCPIHCAAINTTPAYIQQLLVVAPEAVNCLDSFEAGVLHYASVSEKPDTLQWLLDSFPSLPRGAKTRRPKETPLMWAARAARAENIKLLCSATSQEDLEKQFLMLNNQGFTILHLAVSTYRSARFDTVRTLLKAGYKVDVRGDARLADKVTPSMIAARRGDLQMLQLLVEHGANLGATDKLGRTLTIWAAMNGHIDVLSYLIHMGAEVDTEDTSANRAIHYAAAYGWVECLDLLLQHADPDPKNSWSSTPLSLSLKKGSFACAAMLLKLTTKVDVNICDKNGRSLFSSLIGTFLTQLASNKDAPMPWPIVQILKREDLDICSADSSSRTVLHYIAQSPSGSLTVIHDLVKRLLARGLDPLIQDNDGSVAAGVAIRSGKLNLAKLLLDHVSHLDLPVVRGSTLLHFLMRWAGKVEDSQLFIDLYKMLRGRWEDVVDDDGRRPILIAADSLLECKLQEDSNVIWRNSKKVFEMLLEEMPSHMITASLERRKEYSSWKYIAERIEEGGVKWQLGDEYCSDMSMSIFHALCSLQDLDWTLKVCQRWLPLAKSKDSEKLKDVLNLKSVKGSTPVLLVLRGIKQEMTDDRASTIVNLLHLLCECGANMNGVTHPLFSSIPTIVDIDDEVEPTLDIQFGSDTEKFDRVHEYIMERDCLALRKNISKAELRSELLGSFQPYIHVFLRTFPPPATFKAILPLMDVRSKDLEGNTALHVAIENGWTHAALALITHSDVNALNNRGDSPLVISIERNHGSITRALIDKGCDINYASPRLGTALHAAVKHGYVTLVKLLLEESSCNVDSLDKEERTPLHHAIAHGVTSSKQELEPIERQLLRAGAKINAQDIFGRTPAMYSFVPLDMDMMCMFPDSTKRDPVDMLATLSSIKGIRFDIVDSEQRNLLHLAAGVGAVICVLALTESDPDLMNMVDIDNNTPLAIALLAHQWDTALMLISKGSLLNVEATRVTRVRKKNRVIEKERSNQPILWYALKGKGSLATYMLSANRLPIDIVLSCLFHTGSFQKAKQQILQCRDSSLLHVRDQGDGMTVLHRLAQVPTFANAPGFDVALANELIERGLNVEETSTCGWNVLHVAAFHGHGNLINHLIRIHKADVDAMDCQKGTPVSSLVAGSTFCKEILCLLQDASGDPKALANSVVYGDRTRSQEKVIVSLTNPESQMLFETACSGRSVSKEAFLNRLKKKAIMEKELEAQDRESDDKYRVQSTALIEAVRNNKPQFVNALLAYGADSCITDENGRTALHHAAILGYVDILSLLLKWSRNSIDIMDAYGYSALTYAILTCIKNKCTMNREIQVLLMFGADPQIGHALHLVVRHNLEESAHTLLYCAQHKLIPKALKEKELYSVGDVVWTRFGSSCFTWQIVTVVKVEKAFISVVPGRNSILKTNMEQRWKVVDGVDLKYVFPIDPTRDVTIPSHDLLVNHFKHSKASDCDRKEKLKKHRGAEYILMDELDGTNPLVQCVLSPLEVGEVVGHFINESLSMQLGTVISKHPNGLYDIQLMNGILSNKMKRSDLRVLRDELKLENMRKSITLDPTLIHTCVRPFEFGSYENMNILKALVGAGVSIDEKDQAGNTPLDLARPNSKVQNFLRKATKTPSGGRMKKTCTVVSSIDDGIDVIKDSNAALRKLHEEGADEIEKIIPDVNAVCEVTSDGLKVLEDGEDYFDVTMTKVDVEYGRYGKYVFYKMQIVFDPVKDLHILLTNWGRIGESGKYQQTPFSSKEACVKEFHKVFKSKSANSWVNRQSFEKKSGKYAIVDIARTRVKDPEKLLVGILDKSEKPSLLDSSLADTFHSLLSSKDLMAAVREYELDQSQCPLAQMSLDTLDKAEAKLREINKQLALERSQDVRVLRQELETIAQLTNEFYELLPLGDQMVKPFGRGDNRFQRAVELIRVLRDMNVTKQLLLGALHHYMHMNTVDYAYKALKISMSPLELGSTTRKCLQQYIDNTCSDDVLVNQIYSLDLKKEMTEKVGNRKLLFHGSKNLNILGILQQGLRIAPPEAPVSGYAYGKGIYFTDQFTKAYSYASNVCYKSTNQPKAYVFVAEVALGIPHVANGPEYMESPREGTQSTYAPGPTAPDPRLHFVLDETGASVPMGTLESNKVLNGSQYKWVKSRTYWNNITATESNKIERLRNDPNTKFPARLRIKIESDHYDVVLENGPFCDEASAWKVEQEELEEEKLHGEEKDEEPDMSAFRNGNRGCINLIRKRKSPDTKFSEFIVYDTTQIRLKYLIELTSPEWVQAEFTRQNSRSRR